MNSAIFVILFLCTCIYMNAICVCDVCAHVCGYMYVVCVHVCSYMNVVYVYMRVTPLI